MSKIKKNQVVKMNLTLTREFYQLLQKNAKGDFMKVATWTKQFLMKNVQEGNNKDSKCGTQNGTTEE